MIHTKQPAGFTARFAKVACCVKWGDRFLLLLDHDTFDWVLPNGIVCPDSEDPLRAVLRVLRLSTDWAIEPSRLTLVQKVYCCPRFGPQDYECSIYLLKLLYKLEVCRPTHLWISLEDAKRSLGINYPRENYRTRRFMELALEPSK